MRKTLGVTVLLAAVAVSWSGLAAAETGARPLAFRVGLWVDRVSGLVVVQPDTSPGTADSSFAVVSAACPDCGSGAPGRSQTVQVVLQATADVTAGFGVTDLAGTGYTVTDVSQSTSAALAPGQQVTLTVTGDVARREGGFGVSFSVSDHAPPKLTDTWDLTVLHDFTGHPGDGENPRYQSLTLCGDKLCGMASWGGASNLGVVFSLGTDGTGYTVLHHFTGNAADGSYPQGSLIYYRWALYGMTTYGGAFNEGVVFVMGTDGSDFTVLHDLGGGDGSYPRGSLTLSGSTLYGMTYSGGTSDLGVVFSIGTDGNGFTVQHHFAGQFLGDGANPYGSLITDGTNLWGMTKAGGSSNKGVVFLVRTNGDNFTVLHHFTGASNDGANPYGSLISYWTTLYGMTSSGGDMGGGVVFSDSVGGGGFTLLHSFQFDPDGCDPLGDLTRHGSTLYGMTLNGGANTCGAVFSIGTEGNGYAVLHSFDGAGGGAWPWGSLIYYESTLYGMTELGGASGLGVIFRLQSHGLIFADDFETGDTSGWSRTSP